VKNISTLLLQVQRIRSWQYSTENAMLVDALCNHILFVNINVDKYIAFDGCQLIVRARDLPLNIVSNNLF